MLHTFDIYKCNRVPGDRYATHAGILKTRGFYGNVKGLDVKLTRIKNAKERKAKALSCSIAVNYCELVVTVLSHVSYLGMLNLTLFPALYVLRARCLVESYLTTHKRHVTKEFSVPCLHI